MAIPNTCLTDFIGATQAFFDNPEDAEALLDEVHARARARYEQLKGDKAEAYNMSIDELIAEQTARVKETQRQALINVKLRAKANEQVEQFKRRDQGVNAFLNGMEAPQKLSRRSVSASILSNQNRPLSDVLMRLDKDGVTETFKNNAYGDNIGKALYGEKVDDPNISKVAKAIQTTRSIFIKELNMLGANISESGNYIAKLVHNAHRMLSATGSSLQDSVLRIKLFKEMRGNIDKVRVELKNIAYKRWKSIIEPLLDKERTLENVSEADAEKFYKSVYTSITTGIHKVPYDDGGNPLITRTGSNWGKKLSAKRVLHFKDASSWIKYNREYGFGNVHDAVIEQLRSMGRALGVMKKLGSSPRTFGEGLIRKYEEESRENPYVKRNIRRARQTLSSILGDVYKPMDGLTGHIFQAWRTIKYLHLGAITLHSTPDVNTMVSALRPFGITWLKPTTEAWTNFMKGLPEGELKQIGLQMGIYSDGIMGNLFSKFGAPDLPGGIFAKLMQIQDTLTLINRWDNTTRWTMGYMIGNHLAGELDKSFDNLIESEKAIFQRYGVDDKIWKLLQSNKEVLTKVGGKKFLTPAIAQDLSDESIAKIYYGNKLPKTSAVKLEAARRDVHEMLYDMFTDQTAYGKILPTESDRSLMQMGLPTDRLGGKIWQLLNMFKSYHVSMMRRTFGRFIYGQNGEENLYQALRSGKVDYNGMLKYILGSIPYGYLSYAGSALALGKALPSLQDPKTWFHSLVDGGGLGIYGSFIMNEYGRNPDLLEQFGGPVLTNFADTADMLVRLSEGKNIGNKAITLLKSNLPFGNLIYAKAIMDHAIFNKLHELVDPNYREKLIDRANKENQHYLWMP